MGVDLLEPFGGDLSFGPSPTDIADIGNPTRDFSFLIDRDELIQRIIRRLLTSPGEWLADANYGAGVRQLVNEPLSQALAQQIQSTILGQILLEPDVARSPAPTVQVQQILNGVLVTIFFFTQTQIPVRFSFNPANPTIFTAAPAALRTT
jgi:phage baseplate assembly protein W